ncbi:MAG: NAD+ synthase [Bacteroidetes bacterium]|nr:NAD+ synthase [Bacteroidota bacterium]
MKICLAQLNYRIGDFEANTRKISEAIQEARTAGADLVVFSELAVCGYPPEDLLDYPWFIEKCEQSLEAVAESCQGIAAVVGGVMRNHDDGRSLYNVACFMQNGRIEHVVRKTLLPSYDIFHESRYFEPSDSVQVIDFMGIRIGIAICEDLWDMYNDFRYRKSPVKTLKEAGAKLVIHPSASPFQLGKMQMREKVFEGNADRFELPVVYLNQVGAHTELIFDGRSAALNRNGDEIKQLPAFSEALEYIAFDGNDFFGQPVTEEPKEEIVLLHEALIFGLREYFAKMGFTKAILGSSGGIDSAVVQALATEALGAENVWPVLMPSQYSTDGSVADATTLSENLGNAYTIAPIRGIYDAYMECLSPVFANRPFDVTEENLQARARGMLLMAMSNKFGHILLNTSNKSEMAVGYSTLYGDLCGGLSVLGDVYKMKVYALARYINREKEIIPQVIIDKAPSAELRPGQKDSDSLPPYPLLDEILEFYVERRFGKDEITAEGYDHQTVDRIINLVNRNEYKRFQAPPILRVTKKAFGKGRLMPLVARYV